MTNQLIHCKVVPKGAAATFMCSFVYGVNDKNGRRSLWKSLMMVHTQMS